MDLRYILIKLDTIILDVQIINIYIIKIRIYHITCLIDILYLIPFKCNIN